MDDVFYLKLQYLGIERLLHIGFRTAFVSFHYIIRIVFGGQEYDRYMGGGNVIFQVPAKRVSIHFGHHDIRDDQIDRILVRYFQGFHSIFGNVDIILRSEEVR